MPYQSIGKWHRAAWNWIKSDRPGGVERAGAPGNRVSWRAWVLVAVVAVIAVVWFLGDNTASRIAGAVTAAVALALAFRLLKLRR